MSKVAIVFMKFPVSSEVFASNEIKRLSMLENLEITVVSYRRLSRRGVRELDKLGLGSINIVQPRIPRSVVEFLLFLRFLIISLFALLRITKNFNREFIKQIIVIFPSALLAAQLIHLRVDIIHLFWGHYPSWLLYPLRNRGDLKKSIFLGAYDLELGLPISFEVAGKWSDCIITHSASGHKKLLQYGILSERINLIYRGVDTSKLFGMPNYKIKSIKDRCGAISAGRLVPEKKFFSLIQYFSENIDGYPLVVYGDGKEGPKIKSYLKKRSSVSVSLRSFIKQERLFKQFCEKKFFIFMSEKPGEVLPNVVKEAMLAGCIVICKHTSSIEELIKHSEDGFIIHDYEDIISILQLPDEILQLVSSNAHNKIKKNFSIENTVKNYLGVWGLNNDDQI
tara:strand:+ start:1032 stop:2216 length:1185 start_codon:yes stop_codon:yes gene_type:complete